MSPKGKKLYQYISSIMLLHISRKSNFHHLDNYLFFVFLFNLDIIFLEHIRYLCSHIYFHLFLIT